MFVDFIQVNIIVNCSWKIYEDWPVNCLIFVSYLIVKKIIGVVLKSSYNRIYEKQFWISREFYQVFYDKNNFNFMSLVYYVKIIE